MNDATQTGMKLPQLAKQSGLSISTLYEYLRSGILHPPVRRGPTKAIFNESHLARLKTIRGLREKEKLSLADIKTRLRSEADSTEEDGSSIRNQIIDTALALFSRKHYDKTKISDITDALHMGNGTFYRYFTSKEELFLHCLERLPKIMVTRETWNEVKRETDYITRLRKRGNAMLGSFHSYIGMLNHTKLVLGGDDSHLAEKASECLKSVATPLRKDLDQAIAKGQVRPLDTDLAAYLLLGINEIFGHRLLMDDRYTIEEGFDFIEEFLRHALASSSAPTLQQKPFALTLCSGETMVIRSLSCNGAPHLTGSVGAGTLEVAFESLSTLTLTHDKQCTTAHIRTDAGKTGNLSVDPDYELSGATELGAYTVQIRNVRSIKKA
ncbi:TetR family transcriptional regulator [Desulfoluna spongiiphila]|uniref:TetR family transcriptional regulator n=1 Tax=Desulfoluna spongiiphila TaxID=419481 RepID=UPI001251CD65|nr:TetR family transcriptional regulator [Desulfoluna spongiiphila]VVS90887.1 merr-type hth domain [Desulfoluna spongiiphila]